MSKLSTLPPRQADGHKGTFGTVCVIGGQANPPNIMLGGPTLSAQGALRVGAGLAVLALPQPIIIAALTVVPAATALALAVDKYGQLDSKSSTEQIVAQLPRFNCLAIGPGLGVGKAQQKLLGELIKKSNQPLVIDADGLNNLAKKPKILVKLPKDAILTPHPGEFMRLADAVKLRLDPISPNLRSAAVQNLADKLECVVMLKGSTTIISNGNEVWEWSKTNPALATGGTGDVLTGIIAGLVAQFGSGMAEPQLNLFECAQLGVYIHALAAQAWSARNGSAGMLATDLPHEIPAVLNYLRRHAEN